MKVVAFKDICGDIFCTEYDFFFFIHRLISFLCFRKKMKNVYVYVNREKSFYISDNSRKCSILCNTFPEKAKVYFQYADLLLFGRNFNYCAV